MEKFEEIETTKEYDGYYYEVVEVISIVVLGILCGLKNMKHVHQWAVNERTREFLWKEQRIGRVQCYDWFLCLLKLAKPESLNRCLKKWTERLLPADRKTVSVALDGKGDYLLSVKGNHAGLEADIEDYVQDDSLRKSMDTGVQKEKNRSRLETRTAFNTDDIAWFPDGEK